MDGEKDKYLKNKKILNNKKFQIKMSSIVIHEKVGCPYCKKANDLLHEYGYEFTIEIYDPKHPNYEKCKKKLEIYTGSKTFPQIYVGNYYIGGYDDLSNLSEDEFREIVKKNKK